jgi:hypothetical protein
MIRCVVYIEICILEVLNTQCMYVGQFKMTKWCETKWSNFLASLRIVGGVICKYVVQSQVIE